MPKNKKKDIWLLYIFYAYKIIVPIRSIIGFGLHCIFKDESWPHISHGNSMSPANVELLQPLFTNVNFHFLVYCILMCKGMFLSCRGIFFSFIKSLYTVTGPFYQSPPLFPLYPLLNSLEIVHRFLRLCCVFLHNLICSIYWRQLAEYSQHLCLPRPGTHFINGLWAHNWNLAKFVNSL